MLSPHWHRSRSCPRRWSSPPPASRPTFTTPDPSSITSRGPPSRFPGSGSTVVRSSTPPLALSRTALKKSSRQSPKHAPASTSSSSCPSAADSIQPASELWQAIPSPSATLPPPHPHLFSRAAAVIPHAGLNTVLESLAEGVPLVAVPLGNDQPGVAARVA